MSPSVDLDAAPNAAGGQVTEKGRGMCKSRETTGRYTLRFRFIKAWRNSQTSKEDALNPSSMTLGIMCCNRHPVTLCSARQE